MRKHSLLAAMFACTPLSAVQAVEINTNPLWLVFGVINGNALFTLTEDGTVKIGPSFQYLSLGVEDINLSANSLGVRLEKSFAETAYDDGAFLALETSYVTATVRDSDNDCSLTASGPAATGLIGYGWFFKSGFSSRLAAGYSVINTETDEECESEDFETTAEVLGGVTLEWTLGYRF